MVTMDYRDFVVYLEECETNGIADETIVCCEREREAKDDFEVLPWEL